MRAFGFLKGAEIYGKSKYSRRELSLTIPGFRGTLLLRGKTSDRLTFQKIFVDGEYRFDLGFTPRTILDGGANVGYSSLFFARQYPRAVILAVEPEEANFRLLRHNTAGYPNIRPVQKALWPRKTHLAIENVAGQPDAFRVKECSTAGDCTIPTSTIVELLREAGAQQLDLLKLDVEGAEKELFEDPDRESWLRNTRAVIMEPHDWFKPGCMQAVERAMAGGNFSRTRIGENLLFIRQTPSGPV